MTAFKTRSSHFVEEANKVNLDPDKDRTKNFSLRLNDYELNKIRLAAKKQHRSMHSFIIDTILNECEKLP